MNNGTDSAPRTSAASTLSAHYSNSARVSVTSWHSPIGTLWLADDASAIIRVMMPGTGGKAALRKLLELHWPQVLVEKGSPVLSRAVRELEQYFSGSLTVFSTPARPLGTAFQRRVWKAVADIPYGQTRTYGWVALQIGIPGGARAVGQANRLNPVPLLVPCHRVTACQGKLGGYSSGLEQKRWLLTLEQDTVSGAGNAVLKGRAVGRE